MLDPDGVRNLLALKQRAFHLCYTRTCTFYRRFYANISYYSQCPLGETTNFPGCALPIVHYGVLLLLLLLLLWCGLGCAACDGSNNNDAALAFAVCTYDCLLACLCDFERALFLSSALLWCWVQWADSTPQETKKHTQKKRMMKSSEFMKIKTNIKTRRGSTTSSRGWET